MAQENEKNRRDESSSGQDKKEKEKEKSNTGPIPLYRKFENLLLEENKKTSLSAEKLLWQKLRHHKNLLPEFPMLTRKIASSNNIESPLNLDNEPNSSSDKRIFFREISQPEQPSKVYGFENEVLSLENMLFKSEDQFNAIGVVGMAGVGKSTLCQEIFNREEVKKHFVPRIWVCMSRRQIDDQNFQVVIVKQMLECLGFDEEIIRSIPKDHELDGLLYTLHLQLIGKRYLIVIDDCQDEKDWYKNLFSCLSHGEKWGDRLSNGLPKGYGGTVIVTSRDEEIAKKMVGEKRFHKLRPLSDPEICWSIYEDAIGQRSDSPVSDELKEELKRKCGGLPLAAKLMGQIKAEQLGIVPSKATIISSTKQ